LVLYPLPSCRGVFHVRDEVGLLTKLAPKSQGNNVEFKTIHLKKKIWSSIRVSPLSHSTKIHLKEIWSYSASYSVGIVEHQTKLTQFSARTVWRK
jgi:hypothetical protein